MATTAPAACDISRLPEEILMVVISRTTPRAACRAAAVSRAFRAAADSDAVWARFLPRDLPPLQLQVHPAPPPSRKKHLFMRLSACPVLLDGGLMSMWLDRESGAKCYMLSARALHILGGDKPQYWSWLNSFSRTKPRFNEFALLKNMSLLEICGKIQSKMLSQNSTYAAYMVFGIAMQSRGLRYPAQEASVSIGEMKSTRQVCVGVLENTHWHTVPANVRRPKRRADNRLELEMGRFYNEDGDDDDEVSISLMETRGGNLKSGLVIHGIEIRAEN